MAYQIQVRRDTAANWTAINPVLAQGEKGLETNTNQTKTGDGVTAWTGLAYDAGGGGSAHVIQDEGVSLTNRSTMNFVGAGVTVTDAGGKTVVTIPSGSGHTIEDEGAALTDRATMNFVGAGVTVTDAGGKTVVTIPSGGGHTIEDDGVAVTDRATMNFVGTGVTVTDAGGKTVVTIPSSLMSFFLSGDSGPTQTVDNAETVVIAGGTGIDSVASATNTVTLNLDAGALAADAAANTALQTVTSAGAGVVLPKAKVGTDVDIKSLLAGENVVITDGTNEVTVRAVSPSLTNIPDILIAFMTGQSVIGGVTAAGAAGYTANSNMYEWKGSHRSGTTFLGAPDAAWVTWNPAAAVLPTNNAGDLRQLGSTGAQTAQWVYDALDKIQRKTGKLMFVICTSMGGLDMVGWDTPSGTMYTFSRDAILAATNALIAGTSGAPAAYPSATHCNLFLMSHGETDANNADAGVAPYNTLGKRRGAWNYYATEYKALFDQLVTDTHLHNENTWCLFSPPLKKTNAAFVAWRGHEYAAAKKGNHFQVIDTTYIDNYDASGHPTVGGHAAIATQAVELILSGIKSNYRPDALEYLQEDEAPVLGADLNANLKKLTNIGRIQNNGGATSPFRSVNNANITVTIDDFYVQMADTLTANRTIALPALATCLGQIFYVYFAGAHAGFKVIIDPNGAEAFVQHTFQVGSATQILAQNETLILYATSVGWYILSRAITPDGTWHVLSANTTISHHQRYVQVTAAGNTTQTLPPAAECYGMGEFVIKNTGAGNVTVAPAGAETFDGAAGNRTLATGKIGIYRPISVFPGAVANWLIMKESVI